MRTCAGSRLIRTARSARTAAPTALDLYRRFVPALSTLIAPRGIAILEASPENTQALEALVRVALPTAGCETVRDYGGHERFVVAAVPPAS